MPKDMIDMPLMGRAASVRPETANAEERTIEICWTTGATVPRVRWEGWDDRVEFDEELIVSPNAIRLERINSGGPFLDSHRGYGLETVLGSVVPGSVRIEGGSGFATIKLTSAPDASGKVQRILEGTVRNVSVGYRVYQYEITRKEGEREHWRAVDWEPMEISAVAMPADPGAQTRSAEGRPAAYPCVLIRSQDPTAAESANRKEGSMPKDNQRADDQATDLPEAQNSPTAPTAGSPETRSASDHDVDAATQRAIAAERERTSTINQICRRHGLDGEFAGDLVARGVSVAAAREAILDHLAENAPMEARSYEPARARDDGSRSLAYRTAVEIALMHRAGAAGVEMTDDAREFRGLTLMEVARAALERSGVNTRGMSKMELAAAALGQRAVGYHTTGDFPAVLANIGNKTLRAAYADVPRTFTAWARRATLSDFRPTTRVQVSNAPQLEKVLEGAEFQYGTFGEASTQYALATYGKIIAFTRQMLINDDLGAFTRVSMSFGARAAQLEADLVYAILINNPVMADGVALFHADHGNLGAASVINETGLTAAYTAFAQQTDIDGTSIDVSPEFIIVPPGQREVEARKILSTIQAAGTEDVNVYANRLRVISERRLMPTAGQAPWFLSATPALIDTVEYAYLDGQDGVFTETRNGFEVDGVEVKARLDFATSAIDHRGLWKNPGAAPA